MATKKQVVEKMLKRMNQEPKEDEKILQSFEWCAKFAVEDLKLAKKELSQENILKRADVLFKIHGE